MKRGVSAMMMLLLASVFTLAFNVPAAKAATSGIWLVDPGPDGYPDGWTASNPDAGCVGTQYFNFTEPDCGTFFMNVTIHDVSCMVGWYIGVIYDNATLGCLGGWLPTDHVFKPLEDMGYVIPQIAPIVEDVDATHKEVVWSCDMTAARGVWCFNGTGTLCQIQFNMTQWPDFMHQVVTAVWGFDPAMTSVDLSPSGSENPSFNSAYMKLIWMLPILPEFYTSPSEYKAYLMGEDVAIEVRVKNVDAGWAIVDFQFSLWYNTSMLELTSCENGTWLDTFTSNNESVVYAVLLEFGPNDIGWLGGHAYMTPGLENQFWPPYPGEPGGTLFRFHFKPVSETIFPAEDWTWLEINETATTNAFGMDQPTGPPAGCHFRAPVKGLIGDIDLNGRVDMGDVGIVLDAFGSFPTNPRWNPLADIDGNGRVDMTDIVIVLTNFGQHQP